MVDAAASLPLPAAALSIRKRWPSGATANTLAGPPVWRNPGDNCVSNSALGMPARNVDPLV